MSFITSLCHQLAKVKCFPQFCELLQQMSPRSNDEGTSGLCQLGQMSRDLASKGQQSRGSEPSPWDLMLCPGGQCEHRLKGSSQNCLVCEPPRPDQTAVFGVTRRRALTGDTGVRMKKGAELQRHPRPGPPPPSCVASGRSHAARSPAICLLGRFLHACRTEWLTEAQSPVLGSSLQCLRCHPHSQALLSPPPRLVPQALYLLMTWCRQEPLYLPVCLAHSSSLVSPAGGWRRVRNSDLPRERRCSPWGRSGWPGAPPSTGALGPNSASHWLWGWHRSLTLSVLHTTQVGQRVLLAPPQDGWFWKRALALSSPCRRHFTLPSLW